MSLRIHAVAKTHPGLRRSNNEDSGYVGRRLLLVADGMGGAEFGEIASALAARTVAYLDDHLSLLGSEHDLPAAVEFADTRLLRATESYPNLVGMGTTLTAMVIDRDKIALAHVGDSRAYLLRERRLRQLTKDDSYVQMLADIGSIDQQAVADHPQRNVLLKVLRGAGDGVSAQVSVWDAVPGDRYLLCSDGLSDYVSFELIEQALTGTRDPGRAIDQLIDLTLRAGAPDNVTCVVGDVVQAAGDEDEDEDEGRFVGAAEELGIAPLDVVDQKASGLLKSA